MKQIVMLNNYNLLGNQCIYRFYMETKTIISCWERTICFDNIVRKELLFAYCRVSTDEDAAQFANQVNNGRKNSSISNTLYTKFMVTREQERHNKEQIPEKWCRKENLILSCANQFQFGRNTVTLSTIRHLKEIVSGLFR